MKKLGILLGAAAVLFVSCFSGSKVMAAPQEKITTNAGIADFGKGSASIVLKGKEGQTLTGKEMELYQLFLCENSKDGGSILYQINPQLENPIKTVIAKKTGKEMASVTETVVLDYMQSLKTTSDLSGSYRYFIEELRDEIKKQKILGERLLIKDTKEDGSVLIKGLDYGYYLIDEVSYVAGTHSAASLCMVDTAAPDAQIHIKSDYPFVTKKIQEDDNHEQIKNDGWNDIGDYEIGQTVPYRFESRIPNMNGYDTYYYAWHDKMDEALTFKKESVKIMIQDSSKSYTLSKQEFEVVENPGNGETFQVKVQDIKAIVDREFAGKGYGQSVILRYDAVLNDLAAKDTGRPGFENDVKLEFSNNPDSDGKGQTGETPWDTVVCFTYRLNGLKTNEHGTMLEGAEFRLYYDEKCSQEVGIRKYEGEYHVMKNKTENNVPVRSDSMGKFTIIGLDGGTYWLKEVKTPEGYRPVGHPVKVTVSPEFTEDRNSYIKGDGATERALKKLTWTAEEKELKSDVVKGEGNLIVINHSGVKLPVTGSSAMIALVGLGILLAGSAMIRRKHEE